MTADRERSDTRSAIARAIGLGSAGYGVAHWWALRLSAVALVPLTLWFVASLIAHAGGDHAAFVAWLRAPVSTIMMVLLLLATFHHASLGLQVVIEDYVHGSRKFAALILVRTACIALAVIGVVATLRIAFTG